MFLSPTLVILSLCFLPAATVAKLGLRMRFKNWRGKRAKKRYYRRENRRLMKQAKEAGLLVGE